MKNRILLCLLAFIFWIPVKAQSLSFEVEYEEYFIECTVIQLEPPCVSITYCEGGGELHIPATVLNEGTNYSVTEIGDNAFENCSDFTGDLTIPNTVTRIGESAFSRCDGFDGYLTLGESVTIIDNFAFENCSGFVGNLTIPNTVTRIGESAFSGCEGFDGNLIIPNSVTEIGNSAFKDCENLNGTVILPDNVTSINEYTFQNCSKLDFVLSDNITNIGNRAFYNCQSSVFVLPDNITTIGNSAFYKCKIANIPGQLQTIGDKAFSSSSISHIVIPNNVTSIGKECFSGCTTSGKITMTSITTVPTLGEDAFKKISPLDIFVPVNMYGEYTDTTRTDWSPYKEYISTLPIFIGDGNGNGGSWTDIDNWAGDSNMTEVPSGDVDVFINATAVISSGDIINVNSFSICENGSIIIEDGGQLIHNEGYGQVIMKKEITAYVADDDNKLESGWYTISSAFGEIPTDDLLIGDDYELYRYDEPNQEWENVKYIANGFNTLEPGRGYIYANKNTTTLEITGNPNTSNVTYNLTASGEFLNGFNLIGNPFTHNIYKGEGSEIYNENLADGYYVLTNNGGWATKTDVDPISPAQGILVKTTKAGALEIKKNTTTRSAKRSINNGLISIKVSNEKYEDFAYVTFSGGISLDKISHRNENIPMVYIYDNNASYAIAVMEKEVEEIPIIFEAKNFGKYTMSISAKDFPCKELLLIDNTSGNVTNVLKEDYTFVATEGNFTLKVIPHDKEIEVYTNGNNIIIDNISGDAVVNVYDVAGRVITRQQANSNCKFSSESMQKGVYLINVTDENGSFTKKIIVK